MQSEEDKTIGKHAKGFGGSLPMGLQEEGKKPAEASTRMCTQAFTKYLLSTYYAQLTAPALNVQRSAKQRIHVHTSNTVGYLLSSFQ